MANSSILGGEKAPAQASGRGADALGPSDSSDSGSDIQGERRGLASDVNDAGAVPMDLDSDTDAAGTGERSSAVGDPDVAGADIAPDHIEGGVRDPLDDDALSLDSDEFDELAVDESEDETDDAAAR